MSRDTRGDTTTWSTRLKLGPDVRGTYHFAAANFEYPADPTTPVNELVATWGEFTADLGVVLRLGELNPAAVEVLSVAGYE